MQEEKFMQRCLELASNGLGYVAPNPLVGCVIVHNDEIIGEGYHRSFGTPHAEVHALESVVDKSLLSESTLYVNLEPCSHFGKTPPCSERIVNSGIKRVVIANQDPNEKVNGRGISRLKDAGIDVQIGLMKEEASFLNRRFNTFHRYKRPYIVLKWAKSSDGFIDKVRTKDSQGAAKVSGEKSFQLVHKWRSEEQAIMVGKNTVQMDNPSLTTRFYEGANPMRIVVDNHLELDLGYKVFNEEAKSIILNSKESKEENGFQFVSINFDAFFEQFSKVFFEMNVQSVLIEGGRFLLQSFIDQNLWDEARVFIAKKNFADGVAAPQLKMTSNEHYLIGDDTLEITFNSTP